MKTNNTIDILILCLEGKEYFTAEETSEALKIDRDDIVNAIHQLRIRQGWSIIKENRTAYEREWRTPRYKQIFKIERDVRDYPIHNRGREKGELYEHDSNESYWERTQYVILKRP